MVMMMRRMRWGADGYNMGTTRDSLDRWMMKMKTTRLTPDADIGNDRDQPYDDSWTRRRGLLLDFYGQVLGFGVGLGVCRCRCVIVAPALPVQ
jgi:hypothetical protein